MKIQHKQLLHKITFVFVMLCAPLLVVSGQASAQTTPSLESFCSKYTATSELYACKDGWKGADCSDYLITHDQAHVDICQNSARQAATVGAEPEPDEPVVVDNTNNSNNGASDGLQQVIDQVRGSQMDSIDSSSDKNPESIPDNNYGAYINGKGDKQPIRINKAAGNNRPAIVFINGGGWHSDDKVGDKVSPAAVARGYTTFVATYRLGSSGIYYMYEDVMRAMRHVRNNASMYGVDPNRIAIWGDSAGGSLAMRAAGSGRSGAAAAVGWSAPTNGYTGIFHSLESFAIGVDHSTCIPTDLNGLANVLQTINGGEGNIENDGGIGNNGTDAFNDLMGQGGDGAVGTLTQVLSLAQIAQQSGVTPSSVSGQAADPQGTMEESARRLASKKLLECLDNFNTMSPALFASPLSPPTFLAGYDNDKLVHPGQAYQMRDKLRSMGVPSRALILPGQVSDRTIPGQNHLDYNEKFVGPSLDFLDAYLHP